MGLKNKTLVSHSYREKKKKEEEKVYKRNCGKLKPVVTSFVMESALNNGTIVLNVI